MNCNRVFSEQGASTSTPRCSLCLSQTLRPAFVRNRGRRCRCRADGRQISLFSPSKINLFLRVIRRREDGYHDLASLFHVVDLGDDMHFEMLSQNGKDELTCNMPGVPSDGTNLVIKALNLFRSKTGYKESFRVNLEKQVPAGAGLGGGSANAATTLWAANELTGRPASNADLLQWAGEIGSDISVFFSDGAAFCTGRSAGSGGQSLREMALRKGACRGEIVENVAPPLPLSTPLLLVKPPIGCSTPQIFRALRLAERSTADPQGLLARLAETRTVAQELCVNDLEQPAFDTLGELRDLKERLQKDSGGRFSAVFMTGSGSTIVCVGSDEKPKFLQEAQYSDTFVRPARLTARQPGQWYSRSQVAKAAVAAA